MAEVEKHLQKSSGSLHCSNRSTKSCLPRTIFQYLKAQRLYSLSGQPVPLLSHFHIKKCPLIKKKTNKTVFPNVKKESFFFFSLSKEIQVLLAKSREFFCCIKLSIIWFWRPFKPTQQTSVNALFGLIKVCTGSNNSHIYAIWSQDWLGHYCQCLDLNYHLREIISSEIIVYSSAHQCQISICLR